MSLVTIWPRSVTQQRMPRLARQERDRIGRRVFMVSADPKQSAAPVDREAPAFKARCL